MWVSGDRTKEANPAWGPPEHAEQTWPRFVCLDYAPMAHGMGQSWPAVHTHKYHRVGEIALAFVAGRLKFVSFVALICIGAY